MSWTATTFGGRTGVKPAAPPTRAWMSTGAVVLLGIVVGIVWGVLTPGLRGVVVAPGRAGLLSGSTVHRFDAIAIFACLCAVYGVAAALGQWMVARSPADRAFVRSARGTIVLVIATIAGSALGAWIGGLIAHARYPGAGSAQFGQYFFEAPSLWIRGASGLGMSAPWVLVVVAPVCALIAQAIVVLSNPRADLGVGTDAEIGLGVGEHTH